MGQEYVCQEPIQFKKAFESYIKQDYPSYTLVGNFADIYTYIKYGNAAYFILNDVECRASIDMRYQTMTVSEAHGISDTVVISFKGILVPSADTLGHVFGRACANYIYKYISK